MKYLNQIEIDSYKGINQLTLDGFSQFNLLLGPNSCGKTTLTEAIKVLLHYNDFRYYVSLNQTAEKSFSDSFHRLSLRPYMRITGDLLSRKYFTEITSYEPLNCDHFHGYHNYGLIGNDNTKIHNKEINIAFTDKLLLTSAPLLQYGYVSPETNHISLDKIANDKSVCEHVISYLSYFDHRYLGFQKTNFKDTFIMHQTYGNLDSSFFGGGIRYFLKIAEQVSDLENGILIIDPLEYLLSAGAMEAYVNFLYSVCIQKGIQLFAVAYSQEMIDEWLDILQFHNQLDLLNIYCLKKREQLHTYKKYSGEIAYALRIEKEIDLRTEFYRD